MHNKEKSELVAKAHHLNPVVMVGHKGLTAAVLAEAETALIAHELIKIKIVGDDKHERSKVAQDICDQLGAEFLKLIGNIAIIFRKNQD